MPDINQLPSSTDGIYTRVYRHPKDFRSSDVEYMRADMRSNILLPFAEKILLKERQGYTYTPTSDQFWLACYTSRAGRASTLDFFVSCTNGPIGKKYPIFIYAAQPMGKVGDQYIYARIQCIVDQLMRLIPVRRVFSVFANEPVAEAFASIFSELVNVPRIREPYYAARFTFCTRSTFRNNDAIADSQSVAMRKATLEDVPRAAQLCYGFAAESEPFILSEQDALLEATILQREKQLWILEIEGEIASIVCITREDCDTSAITKVYTSKAWRGRKLAECLVREVTRQLLSNPKKKRVVLFVAHENKPAAKVYHRVGFVGLGNDEQVPFVEPWIEIGFDRSSVDLGHW